MKRLVSATLLCLAFAGAAHATPATEASIEEMLKASNAKGLMESVRSQMDGYMKQVMHQATEGKAVTPERQAILDRLGTEMGQIAGSALDWDKMKPMYVRIYSESFTKEEIDGIVKFYKSPAGKAMIDKMPLVMKSLMGEMQGFMKPMMEQMKAAQQRAMDDLKALDSTEKK
jgi:uncharacterized protein